METVQTSIQSPPSPRPSPPGEGGAERATPLLGFLAGLYRELGVEEHPVLALPDAGAVERAMADGRQEEFVEMLKRRQRRIQLSLAEPMVWGFEAETWGDADRLLGKSEIRSPKPELALGVTDRPHPDPLPQERGTDTCEILAIFGGNRAQKTYYAVKRGCQTAHYFERSNLLIGAETEVASIKTVQSLAWFYLAPHYKHLLGKRDAVHKFNYSQGEGFTNRKIVLPNGSEIHFATYNQDPGMYEGWEFGAPADVYEAVCAARAKAGLAWLPNIGAVMDESMPLKWMTMLSRRSRFRKAKVLWPFTPVRGITPAIKEMVGSSAQTIESRASALLPRQNFPDLPEGHMPYIRKCVMPRAMAIYFFTIYNLWGPSRGRTYYDEVKELCEGKASEFVERVAYGYARDSVARAFPTFGPWNIVKREHLPATGTNYMLTDPADRNWATIWVRVMSLPGGRMCYYIYRDWPDAQTYGEWAVATEREVNEENRKGWDGDSGPAQAGLGFSVVKYKETFLECERVKGENWKSEIGKRKSEMDPYHVRLLERASLRSLPLDKVYEEIRERYVDPRAGASPHMTEQEGGTCIVEEFEREQYDSTGRLTGPGMELTPASGLKIVEGLTMLQGLLEWNREQPLMPIINQPHLFVSEDCHQVRWMFENYTGRSGEKGACKDFADLARYMAVAELEDVSAGEVRGKAGRGF